MPRSREVWHDFERPKIRSITLRTSTVAISGIASPSRSGSETGFARVGTRLVSARLVDRQSRLIIAATTIVVNESMATEACGKAKIGD